VRLRDGAAAVRSARRDGSPPPWARPPDQPGPPQPARGQPPPQGPMRMPKPGIDLPDAFGEADAAGGQ
jgi:hypothetical protein